MKKLFALVLALVLISSCTASAFAASADPPYEAIELDGYAATGALPELSYEGAGSAESNADLVPKLEVTTENGNGVSLKKSDGYVNAQITITDTDGSALSGSVLFKVRGNSSAMDPISKKSFTVKFDKKKNVLGMGSGKKWVLQANCFDPTLLRNYIVFELGRELGLPYTSEQRFAELWLDGQYRGCYTVYEPVGEGKDRVDIDIKSNDGKKDFLLEYEASRVEDDVTYITPGGLRFALSDPDEPTDDQVAYIDSVMTDVVNTIKGGNEAAIRKAIDVDSFAKLYLLNEYAKTADFGLTSVFFFYKDGVLYAGPPWDYDLALGNINGELSSSTAKVASSEGIIQSSKTFYRWLIGKPWFDKEVKRAYADHYDYFESISSDSGVLDTLRTENAELFARNFTVWNPGRWWLNYQKHPFATYDENYQFLKTWCAERNSYLTSYYGLYRYSYVCGDSDGSGEIETTDATMVQRVIGDMITDDDGMIALRSALGSDELDITDATAIQRFLADIETPYPLNEQLSRMLF